MAEGLVPPPLPVFVKAKSNFRKVSSEEQRSPLFQKTAMAEALVPPPLPVLLRQRVTFERLVQKNSGLCSFKRRRWPRL